MRRVAIAFEHRRFEISNLAVLMNRAGIRPFHENSFRSLLAQAKRIIFIESTQAENRHTSAAILIGCTLNE
jgi:hypothetical protein